MMCCNHVLWPFSSNNYFELIKFEPADSMYRQCEERENCDRASHYNIHIKIFPCVYSDKVIVNSVVFSLHIYSFGETSKIDFFLCLCLIFHLSIPYLLFARVCFVSLMLVLRSLTNYVICYEILLQNILLPIERCHND